MSDTQSQTDNEPDKPLENLLSAVRRHVILILACVILTGLFATVVSVLQTKEYTSVASLLFRENTAANSVFGADNAPAVGQDAVREAATNVELVGLNVVSDRTAAELGGNLTGDDVVAAVDVRAQGQSDLVLVEATDPDPEMSQLIANAFAREFINFRATADRSRLLKAKRLADREFAGLSDEAKAGARGEQLSRGAERLGILASLQTGNAELVQPAELPTSPSSPKPVRNGIIGIFLGLLLGIGLAFLAERLNRKLRTPEEAGQALRLPVLGVIPDSKAIAEIQDGRGLEQLPFGEEEAFRMIRASLRYFSVDREIKTLLITSSAPGAGKSTLAWSLTRIASKTAKVVLVETDLRNPSIARREGGLSGPGLAEVLTHQAELEQAIQHVAVGQGDAVGNGKPVSMDVITAGALPPNPADLVESQSMADVIVQLKERYDFVVVNTPPVGVVSDAFPLISQVDGVVVLVRLYRTTRDSADDLRQQLERLDAPTLGVVTNGAKTGRSGQYGYGYGYGDQPSETAPEKESAPRATQV